MKTLMSLALGVVLAYAALEGAGLVLEHLPHPLGIRAPGVIERFALAYSDWDMTVAALTYKGTAAACYFGVPLAAFFLGARWQRGAA